MTKHADSLQETQAKELLRNMLITTVGVESAQLDPLMDLFELVSEFIIIKTTRWSLSVLKKKAVFLAEISPI